MVDWLSWKMMDQGGDDMKGILWGMAALSFLAGCAALDGAVQQGSQSVFLYAGGTAVCAVLSIFFGYRAWHYRSGKQTFRTKLSVKELSDEEAELVTESWQKAVTDYGRIEAASRQIQDGALRQQLQLMQRVAANLLTYLEKHPQSIPAARRFIDTYQDRAAAMAEEYRELEKTGLDTEQVNETREHIKETLASFDEAYEKEFERVLGEKLLDMDAELSVLQKTMEADGIHNASVSDGQLEEKKDRNLVKGIIDDLKPMMRGHGHAPVNRAGRKHPRRCAFRVTEELPAVMPQELRSDVLKEKLIMSALAIFAGAIGAHKFYQGKTKWGILYLLFWWTAIPGIVGIVEGIRYLFMPMDDFYNAYYHRNGR